MGNLVNSGIVGGVLLSMPSCHGIPRPTADTDHLKLIPSVDFDAGSATCVSKLGQNPRTYRWSYARFPLLIGFGWMDVAFRTWGLEVNSSISPTSGT